MVHAVVVQSYFVVHVIHAFINHVDQDNVDDNTVLEKYMSTLISNVACGEIVRKKWCLRRIESRSESESE